MRFLGSCEVCGALNLNYRSLGAHFRYHKDAAHVELKAKWNSWRSNFRNRCCLKCGSVWEGTRDDSVKRRCPECARLRTQLGKRSYENYHPEVKPDARKTAYKSRATALAPSKWERGSYEYSAALDMFLSGDKVIKIRQSVGITYERLRDILCDALGDKTVDQMMFDRKSRTGARNIAVAHANYKDMSPEDKAVYYMSRFGGSRLETSFVNQLQSVGVEGIETNVWQSVRVNGVSVPREVDVKVAVTDHVKIVVFCDGEAFHGPKTIFGIPEDRIAQDVATLQGFYSVGYSAIRYSETEIHNGFAIEHFLQSLDKVMRSELRVSRNWHPPKEDWVLR